MNFKVYSPPSCLTVPVTSQGLIKNHTVFSACLGSGKVSWKQGNQAPGGIYPYWVGSWGPGRRKGREVGEVMDY